MSIIKGKGNSKRPDTVPTGKTKPSNTILPIDEELSEIDKGKDFVKAGETAKPQASR